MTSCQGIIGILDRHVLSTERQAQACAAVQLTSCCMLLDPSHGVKCLITRDDSLKKGSSMESMGHLTSASLLVVLTALPSRNTAARSAQALWLLPSHELQAKVCQDCQITPCAAEPARSQRWPCFLSLSQALTHTCVAYKKSLWSRVKAALIVRILDTSHREEPLILQELVYDCIAQGILC